MLSLVLLILELYVIFGIINIRAVCYLEQQRLDTLCHFSVALDIVRSYHVHFTT